MLVYAYRPDGTVLAISPTNTGIRMVRSHSPNSQPRRHEDSSQFSQSGVILVNISQQLLFSTVSQVSRLGCATVSILTVRKTNFFVPKKEYTAFLFSEFAIISRNLISRKLKLKFCALGFLYGSEFFAAAPWGTKSNVRN